MRIRLPALAVLAVVSAGCADAIETLSPSVYYGFASSAGNGQLCLLAEREGELGAERCFGVDAAAVAGERLQPGDLVRVTYEPAEGESGLDRAVEVDEVNPDL